MKLIPEAKNWWRMWSVWAMGFAGSVQLAILAMPDFWIDNVVFNEYTWKQLGQIAAFISTVLGIVLRQIKQDNV